MSETYELFLRNFIRVWRILKEAKCKILPTYEKRVRDLTKKIGNSETITIWEKACETAGGQPSKEQVLKAIQIYEMETATRAKRNELITQYNNTRNNFKNAIDRLKFESMDTEDLERYTMLLKRSFNNFIKEFGS